VTLRTRLQLGTVFQADKQSARLHELEIGRFTRNITDLQNIIEHQDSL